MKIKKPSFFADKKDWVFHFMRERAVNIMLKTKITFFMLAVFLIPLLLFSSCSLNHLRPGDPINDEVSNLIRNLPPAESYPDADILVILDERIVEAFEDGRSTKTSRMVFKVMKERGKDYADIDIGYNSRIATASIVYARTITPGGEVLPLRKNATKVITPFEKYPSYSDYKKLVFSMPGVTLGSIVDYKVVIQEKKPTMEGIFSSRWIFQGTNPVLLSRYEVIVPKDMKLKYYPVSPLKDVPLSPVTMQQGDKKTYLWEYKNIPQILGEESMPPWDEVAFGILLTNLDSWEGFSSWYREKKKGKTEPDRAIKEKVAELTKDLSAPKEKVEALFNYVKRQIRYVNIDLGKSGYEPASAPEVFKNKYGDCKDKSTLLISMLKCAGIPAYYVAIPTDKVGNWIRYFPYPFQFNHCIVALEKEEEYSFIDPVAENYPLDYLPESDQNRDVLIFQDQKTIIARTPLARPEEKVHYTQYRINVGADGSILAEGKWFGLGGGEAYFRSLFADLTPTEMREVVEESVNKVFPGAKLLECTHSDGNNCKEDFVVKIRLYAEDYCKKAKDFLLFTLPEVGEGCGDAGKKDRRYPIVSGTNSCNKKEVEFNIPEGHEVYHLPESVEIANPYFEFRSDYRREGEKVIYKEEFVKKAIRIMPENYPAYNRLCQEMGKNSKKEVLFRKEKHD